MQDVEYHVADKIYKTLAEATERAFFANLSCGEPCYIDVVIWSEDGAREFGEDDAVERYKEDPDASVFERIQVKIELLGRVA